MHTTSQDKRVAYLIAKFIVCDVQYLLTIIDTLDMSIAFKDTSSRSLSGVAIRNSGSQLFSLVEQSEHRNQHLKH